MMNRRKMLVASLLIGALGLAPLAQAQEKGLIGISMPVYWLGEVMNLITQSRYHDTWLFSWVPPLGYKPLLEDPRVWPELIVDGIHLRPELAAWVMGAKGVSVLE